MACWPMSLARAVRRYPAVRCLPHTHQASARVPEKVFFALDGTCDGSPIPEPNGLPGSTKKKKKTTTCGALRWSLENALFYRGIECS